MNDEQDKNTHNNLFLEITHKKGKRCKHYSVILMPQTSTPHSVTWMLVCPKVWKCFLTQIKLKFFYHHISSEVWCKTTQKEREVTVCNKKRFKNNTIQMLKY